MGAPGWLARRVLSVVLFPVLVGFWYAVFVTLVLLPPGSLGFKDQALAEVFLVSLVAAAITDFAILRLVKRRMSPEPSSRR